MHWLIYNTKFIYIVRAIRMSKNEVFFATRARLIEKQTFSVALSKLLSVCCMYRVVRMLM